MLYKKSVMTRSLARSRSMSLLLGLVKPQTFSYDTFLIHENHIVIECFSLFAGPDLRP